MKKGETRNPNGRPKKGESLTELMQIFLSRIEPKSKKTYRQLFIEKSYVKALDGDPTFAKLVWNYMDGMPVQKLEVSEVNVSEEVNKIEELNRQKKRVADVAKKLLK